MSSQKSTAAPVAPKRQRGRDRVAAIMDAAAIVFAEKGYDLATMTEIAAQADTAIGSLYRFFPTKEALADAFVIGYGAHFLNALDEIEAEAGRLSPAALAGALIDVMLGLRAERAAAIALINARSNAAAEMRSTFGAAVRGRIVAILTASAGPLPSAKGEAAATLLLHVLKSLPALVREDLKETADVLGEARALVGDYISSLGR
ncbi:transcriptional regulator, TetR family [Methylocella silvestris BL2]|uniref:Transcriptional regulator, TetR family n=1 Tax=Methylocella silvestris (strain DSM 15510 / CIP 108128 / LMG 27833 / NCIMB 13906 / BL2) TaxID=395965 RepID=B8ELT5_METSB|nr:TetR/AcrR family transcriptional regulator [Methylocella silvestris]ACK50716.1 transcriptional regulator, TetR family [Methylocella silvestris BL2]